MKSNNDIRINQLLRLAELCDSEQKEKRNYYMNLAEELILGTASDYENSDTNNCDYVPDENKHLFNFYESNKDFIDAGNTSANIYELYLKFCADCGSEPLNRLSFSKNMCNYFSIKTMNKRIGEHVLKVWMKRK